MPARATLVILATLLLSPAIAHAAGGSGALTAPEYQQMQSLQTRLKTVKPTSLGGYQAMLWACEQIQMQTPLLTGERAVCDDYAQMNVFGLKVVKQGTPACVARTHTLAARLNCLAELFVRWYPSIHGFYSADVSVLHIATSRRLGTACVEFLAGVPKQITYAKKLASATRRIIAAARAGSLTDFEAEDGIFVTDAARLQGTLTEGPAKLSACRHL